MSMGRMVASDERLAKRMGFRPHVIAIEFLLSAVVKYMDERFKVRQTRKESNIAIQKEVMQ